MKSKLKFGMGDLKIRVFIWGKELGWIWIFWEIEGWILDESKNASLTELAARWLGHAYESDGRWKQTEAQLEGYVVALKFRFLVLFFILFIGF